MPLSTIGSLLCLTTATAPARRALGRLVRCVREAVTAIGVKVTPAGKNPGAEGERSMDELKQLITTLTQRVDEMKATLDSVVTEVAALKTTSAAEIAAITETLDPMSDDVRAVDAVSEKLLERVEALEAVIGRQGVEEAGAAGSTQSGRTPEVVVATPRRGETTDGDQGTAG